MRLILSLIVALCATVSALAQSYQPAKGETDLKLSIEGRGDVYIKLFTKEAPRTTQHIVKLAKDGFYNGQRFHRVERDPRPYLAWFGDPQSKSGNLDDPNMGKGGSGTKVPFEDSGKPHVVGAVGLAHPVNDRDGGDSQFYLVLGPASFLDGNYTVFGQVVAGEDVMQKIQRGDRVSSVSVVTG